MQKGIAENGSSSTSRDSIKDSLPPLRQDHERLLRDFFLHLPFLHHGTMEDLVVFFPLLTISARKSPQPAPLSVFSSPPIPLSSVGRGTVLRVAGPLSFPAHFDLDAALGVRGLPFFSRPFDCAGQKEGGNGRLLFLLYPI